MTKIITIKLPKDENSKWQFGFGSGGNFQKRKDPLFMVKAIEKRLLRASPRSPLNEKMAITIKVGNCVVNETCDSQNTAYLLYCLICFLEDYITKSFFRIMFRKYHVLGQEP